MTWYNNKIKEYLYILPVIVDENICMAAVQPAVAELVLKVSM